MFKRIQKIFFKKNITKNLKKRTMLGVNDSLTTIGFLVNEEDHVDFDIFFALFNTIFLALSLPEHLPLAREFFRIKPWKKILITAKFSQ